MPHQEKNNLGRYNQLNILLPITGTIFSKKPVSVKSPDENSIDFHLAIIKKIDSLLAKHEPETSASESFHGPRIIPAPRPVPVEPRPPLNKTLSHQEIAWEPTIEPSQTMKRTIPEEFKTELTLNPEFKFITSQEFKDTVMRVRPSERIEIIDLNTFIEGNTYFNKTIVRNYEKNLTKEKITTPSEKSPLTADIHNKKTEVIDIQTLKQKIHENFFVIPKNKTEKNEKPHIYFFSSKNDSNKKQKKPEDEQSYIPIDFEERFKKLTEEQIKAEEQRKQQEQEMYKQLERERENLEERFKKLKEEQIKAEEQRKQQEAARQRQLEQEREKLREQQIKEEQRKQQEAARQRQLEREREKLREQQIKEEQRKQQEQEINRQLQQEREKLEKLEMKKAFIEQKNQEFKQTEQKIPEQIPQLSMFNKDYKKQAKEQKRLQRLEIRQARLELLRRKKEEKQKLKMKLKQQRLMQRGTVPKQKQTKQKTSGIESLELDEDIKKILLMTDTLLGELPEGVINQFMQSEEFELYQKVLNKYKVK